MAAVLHIAPFLATAFGVGPLVMMRRMGEADGDPAGISVEVVDEATLASLSTPPPQQPRPLQPEPTPPQPPQAEPTPPSEPTPAIRGTTAPESPQDGTPSKQPPREIQPENQAAKQAAKQPGAKAPPQPKDIDDMVREMTELFAPAPPAKRPTEKASDQQPSPRDAAPNAATSELDKPIEFQANSSSVARPADITRSGENDEFGRGVVRALRQTMPVPWGIRSRVTIKFLLSERGEVVEMQLVKGSGYPLVDQSVVYAARNSTFPMPAKGSKVSDRIFLVTYIYD